MTCSVVIATFGAVLIARGSQTHPPKPAPLPSRTFDIGAAALPAITPPTVPKVVTQAKPVAVTDPAGGGCSARLTPNHVAVPSLCINAAIVTIGSGPSGLAIPDDVHRVGLWNGGAQLLTSTGAVVTRGTTLLAGHVDSADQGAGALYALHTITPGALVYVVDGQGLVTTWRAASLTVVVKASLPSWLFARDEGPRRLALVTCGGPIEHIPGAGASYRDNVIVGAIPVR